MKINHFIVSSEYLFGSSVPFAMGSSHKEVLMMPNNTGEPLLQLEGFYIFIPVYELQEDEIEQNVERMKEYVAKEYKNVNFSEPTEFEINCFRIKEQPNRVGIFASEKGQSIIPVKYPQESTRLTSPTESTTVSP